MSKTWTELYEMYKGGKEIYDTLTADDGPPQQQIQARPENIKRGRSVNNRVKSGKVAAAQVTRASLGYGDPGVIHNTFVGHTLRNYRLS